ncbi:MAG: histidine ammonia-lyase [Anaerolineae bacterium]
MHHQKAEPHHSGTLLADGNSLTVEDVIDVARHSRRVGLSTDAAEKVAGCRAWVDHVVEEGKLTVYGLNTGFGSLAEVTVAQDMIETLSRNMIVSHSAGVGPPLAEEVVRATMLIRANTLAKGHSGIRVTTLQTLLDMLNKGVHPVVPEKGSVGASGDLVPLSHLVLALSQDIDGGEAFYEGRRMDSKEAMREAGIDQVALKAKEGLALNNGSTVSAALATLALYDAEMLVKNAQIALAMSLEAMRGVSDAFHEKVQAARGHDGQIRCAANVLRLLDGSELIDSTKRVQDAYCLRCAPQVIGAVGDVLAFVRLVLSREINAATDNPLIFLDLPPSRENKAISCGNFHGEPVALAMDMLSMAVAELGNISERRTFRLLDNTLSAGLPPMLVEESGLNNGLMMAQYVAAALVSDNKTLAHPDSVDSIPTSANQEDHVSMSTNAARHAREVVWNVGQIVSIEVLCAAQALDFRRAGLEFSTTSWHDDQEAGRTQKVVEYELKSGKVVDKAGLGKGTQAAYDAIRREIDHLSNDRPLYPDLERIAAMVHAGEILHAVEEALGAPLEGIGELLFKPE